MRSCKLMQKCNGFVGSVAENVNIIKQMNMAQHLRYIEQLFSSFQILYILIVTTTRAVYQSGMVIHLHGKPKNGCP